MHWTWSSHSTPARLAQRVEVLCFKLHETATLSEPRKTMQLNPFQQQNQGVLGGHRWRHCKTFCRTDAHELVCSLQNSRQGPRAFSQQRPQDSWPHHKQTPSMRSATCPSCTKCWYSCRLFILKDLARALSDPDSKACFSVTGQRRSVAMDRRWPL